MEQLIEKLNRLTDIRRQWGNLRHKLVDIVFIGLVSVICGGTDFAHMEDTGYGKLDWFKERLELPNGIPDSDTFRRVFERLDPQELAEILQETVATEGKTVAIDGKTICGSANARHRAYHVVSAWVAENQITFWANLNGIGMVKTNVITMKTGEVSEERRYYLTSHTAINSFAHAVRSHWSIESQLHWRLMLLSARTVRAPEKTTLL